jgi:hypothetical protein
MLAVSTTLLPRGHPLIEVDLAMALTDHPAGFRRTGRLNGRVVTWTCKSTSIEAARRLGIARKHGRHKLCHQEQP